MKLQSMVDFVLNLNLDYGTVFSETVLGYAIFLKKPLELWMFVPCGENGEVLEEKMIFANQDKDYVFEPLEFDQYQKAKSKVLFEGFVAKEVKTQNEHYYLLNHKGQLLWISWNTSKTIESLLEHNAEIELTQTAQKQFE